MHTGAGNYLPEWLTVGLMCSNVCNERLYAVIALLRFDYDPTTRACFQFDASKK